MAAHYEPAIATMCNSPDHGDATTPPYRWYTHPPIASSSIWWVVPDTGGTFAAGPIHVEVQVTGGTWAPTAWPEAYLLTGVVQWDGKAVRG